MLNHCALFGAAISLLSLATPISVQLLINSVANTALPAPLLTLAAILFTLLVISGVLSAFRVHLLALFERRFFARLVAEITLRAVHAQNPFFVDSRRGDLFNRFFDMGVVQKSLTSLLIGGFTIVLQSLVGLIVTSFYHPFFLAFNLVLVLLVLIIWRIWASASLRTAVIKSHAKHANAHWLESVGGSNGRRVTITCASASPGTSTPVQKLSVPKRTALPARRISCVSSVRERSAPCIRNGRPAARKRGSSVCAIARMSV